jgi:hypothetical protein
MSILEGVIITLGLCAAFLLIVSFVNWLLRDQPPEK